MLNLDLDFIYQAFGQVLSVANQPVTRVVIDSRQIQPGDVFVAIQGERFDGHDFIDEVLAQGARLCIVSRDDCQNKAHCLVVADTEKALGQLAHAWRMAVNPALQVFGITGSAGKTTVKEMLAAILRHYAGNEAVLATTGNFNNHIGLPLTLLQLQPQHRYAVIEMGMNHAGELGYLTSLACPDYALVNNALRAHIGCGFADVADIARAKSEIYEGLGADGIGFVPADDSQSAICIAALRDKRYICFGTEQGDVHAENIVLQPLGICFDLHSPQGVINLQVPVPGLHMVHNAVAACALALAAGLPLTALRGLNEFENAKGRLQQKRGVHGALVIDDTYNANPDAFKAAIDVLAAFAAPRIIVMGAIGELGSNAPALHAEVGAYIRKRGIEAAFFIGDNCQYAAEAYGVAEALYQDRSRLIDDLRAWDQQTATILVKGSRFMHMEDVVQALTQE
ncbi:MAG: UDP-N-acetylmuramoyl-tripeptide--D-alanyl-D-alanine ligase [Snodgrassella sp.]|uniref:UDP-N-acetylmuramoyl-tripeptide--D-alanyl-D- alanine ligase n=1 Tax=Snodgrassella sp. TaxID=2815304 RepID=UPI002588532A|nr:UDP-N-acetylmuramoyl-tripeptide--D-alanyl-D-alanine ligase [Snodgrassella sp.]MCO6508115.1 UDP-N-acetylmuramoyl-tripeptide--D-alanyl-D-alanine ligase [Snodgrassella sp.]